MVNVMEKRKHVSFNLLTRFKDSSNYYEKEIKKYIDGKIKEVYEYGLVLLNPMDRKNYEIIKKHIKGIQDISFYVIGDEDNERIVLKKENKESVPRIYDLSKESEEAYNNGDYDLCIACSREIIELDNEFPEEFSKIGYAYLQKGYLKVALDYFLVAEELAKKKIFKLDSQEMISLLKSIVLEDGINFINNGYFGIPVIYKIVNLVSMGINIFEACETFMLTYEEVTLVLLIFARECFKDGEDILGNKYLDYAKKREITKGRVENFMAEIELLKNKYHLIMGNNCNSILKRARIK